MAKFWNWYACQSNLFLETAYWGETARFQFCFAHLAPKVLLVFTIHEIFLSSICSSPKMVFLLHLAWKSLNFQIFPIKFILVQIFALLCIIMLPPCTVTYAVSSVFLLVHTSNYIKFYVIFLHCKVSSINCAEDYHYRLYCAQYICIVYKLSIQLVLLPIVLFCVGIDLALGQIS